MSIVIKESVRGIVEYVLKSGSIDDTYISRSRAIEGTLAHTKLQKDNQEIYDNYEKEVSLECTFLFDGLKLLVYGRADGIIKDNGSVIIEEIKSTYKDLVYIDEEYNLLHWAQNKFYGYIYCTNNNIDDISIRLSYYNLNTGEVKSFDKVYKKEQLEEYINTIIQPYIKTIINKITFNKIRDKSIKNQQFPFKEYREGQRELAITCYKSIKQKGLLFAQAPTGIGKTISTIFSALKNLGEGRSERIVYLTSKSITRVVAEEAFNKLFNNGLKFRLITLTAKEKICINNEIKCNPKDCIYAVDYFSKINEVISNILTEEYIFTRDNIMMYANKFTVCPFELSLDLTNFCDGIICDYNYAFDPRVRLKRIFEEDNEENIILIDEAHNLVNRARDMYSAGLSKAEVLSICRVLKGQVPKLYKIVNSINKELIIMRRELEEDNLEVIYKNDECKELIKLLRGFIVDADEYLLRNKNVPSYETVKDFYFEVKKFISIGELYSSDYLTILRKEKNDFNIKLFCIDPSRNISNIINSSYSTVIFSATLSPIGYYVNLLGGNEQSFRITLDSPFNKENLQTLVYPLDMRFTIRNNNIDKLCYIIHKFISEIRGNYMVFLPSFKYLNDIYTRYIELYEERNTIFQEENLSEIEKEIFLNNFKEDSEIVAFTVVGGMFSEGIDLPGKLLIGAVIVGVGFPMVSIENEIIRNYFNGNGFDYAYTYPGINKVLQSAGRVIRTESDKGRVLLVDKRYLINKYRSMLPKQWELKIYK